MLDRPCPVRPPGRHRVPVLAMEDGTRRANQAGPTAGQRPPQAAVIALKRHGPPRARCAEAARDRPDPGGARMDPRPQGSRRARDAPDGPSATLRRCEAVARGDGSGRSRAGTRGRVLDDCPCRFGACSPSSRSLARLSWPRRASLPLSIEGRARHSWVRTRAGSVGRTRQSSRI